MRVVWSSNCHKCESDKTVVYDGISVAACGKCGFEWADYKDYAACFTRKRGIQPYPTRLEIPDVVWNGAAEYMETGKLEEDLQKLVDIVAAEVLLHHTDRVDFHARNIIQSSMSESNKLSALYDIIERERNKAKNVWDAGRDGDI